MENVEKPKIYLIDIETAPNLSWVWGKYEQNTLGNERHWYMLSFGIKELGKGRPTVYALPDYEGYENDKHNDKQLVEQLWKFFDEADVIIAHNGDAFDIRKANARFIAHQLPPPSPYKSVDTKKIAKKIFKFDSNKLDDLGHYLKVGRKVVHTGFDLWLGCMSGNEKSWKMMRRYNAGDLNLLERIYYALRPWATTHPNINKTYGTKRCPKCGSHRVQCRGFSYTLLKRKQRYQCQSCGGWHEGAAKA